MSPNGRPGSPGTPPDHTSPLAKAIAVRSAPVLLWLHQLPRWTLVLVLGTLLVVGLYSGGVLGGILLLILAAVVGWLLLLAWPLLETGGRLSRLTVVLALALVGILEIKG